MLIINVSGTVYGGLSRVHDKLSRREKLALSCGHQYGCVVNFVKVELFYLHVKMGAVLFPVLSS